MIFGLKQKKLKSISKRMCSIDHMSSCNNLSNFERTACFHNTRNKQMPQFEDKIFLRRLNSGNSQEAKY